MKKLIFAGAVITLGLLLGADIAANRDNYVPKNDVEGRNYNARQKLADNPATLIWCTTYPPTPNAKAFTVPAAMIAVGIWSSRKRRGNPATAP